MTIKFSSILNPKENITYYSLIDNEGNEICTYQPESREVPKFVDECPELLSLGYKIFIWKVIGKYS